MFPDNVSGTSSPTAIGAVVLSRRPFRSLSIWACHKRIRMISGAQLALFLLLQIGSPRGVLAQVVGADGRVQSGVTVGNGQEMGPHVAIRGNLGAAVWYEDRSSQPIHSAFTTNGGSTWAPAGLLPVDSPAGNASLSVDDRARFYEVNLRFLPGVGSRGVEVRRGEILGGSLVWGPVAQAASGNRIEHPAIACDPVASDVYVSYTHAYQVSASPLAYSSTVYLTHSSDGGSTWSVPVSLSPATCHGSQVAVGPDGEVYVVWQDFASALIMLRRSLDHGQNFEPAVAVGPILENANTTPPGILGAGPRTHTTWPASMRVPHYPVLAVDRSASPRRGTVYVTWPEMASGIVGPYLGEVEESEPNNYFINATPVQIGQDLIGFVPSADVQADWDYWSFEGTAGQTVALSGSYDYFPTPQDETGYGVLGCGQDTLQKLELTRTRITGNTPFTTQPLEFTLPYTGRYYIPVVGAGAYSRSYRLQLREVQVDPLSVARDHRDLVMVASSDGGESWSAKVRVSRGPERYDDILPAVAVDEVGQVHVTWYGRQDDPACGVLANTYWTLSRDGGGTFLSPERVSSVSSTWNVDPIESRVAGDRLGLATTGTTAQLMWMDSRNWLAQGTDIYGALVEAGGPTAVVISQFTAAALASSIRLQWRIEDATGIGGFRIQRAWAQEAWEDLAIELPSPAAGPDYAVTDSTAEAGKRYRYRLEVVLTGGTSLWAGPVEVDMPPHVGHPSLRVFPNPARGPVAISLTLPAAEEVSMAVFDLAGKEVLRLHEGAAPAGLLQLSWEGLTREGHTAPSGLYWVRARLGGRQIVQRLARVQ
jgi:hypothetical protein